MRFAAICCCVVCCLGGSAVASTGFIEGTVKSADEKTFVVTGVNHYEHGETEVKDHKMPGKGSPIYILDGELSTREATVKIGRECFVFWNRHTLQMVVALTGPDEQGVAKPGVVPVPAGQNVNTVAGVIKSFDDGSVVFTVTSGDETTDKTVECSKAKTIYLFGTRFKSAREETLKPGRKAVAFCYRGRAVPNFVVAMPDQE